jgi:hypothetical protein
MITLTNEQIASNLEAYKHAMEVGHMKDIDYLDDRGIWVPKLEANFLLRYDYRIRPAPPEPKWRAWKPEEVPLGVEFKLDTWIEEARSVIVDVAGNSIGTGWNSRHEFTDCVTHGKISLDHGKNWTPAGVLCQND